MSPPTMQVPPLSQTKTKTNKTESTSPSTSPPSPPTMKNEPPSSTSSEPKQESTAPSSTTSTSGSKDGPANITWAQGRVFPKLELERAKSRFRFYRFQPWAEAMEDYLAEHGVKVDWKNQVMPQMTFESDVELLKIVRPTLAEELVKFVKKDSGMDTLYRIGTPLSNSGRLDMNEMERAYGWDDLDDVELGKDWGGVQGL
ncbi:hypothetical protein QBC39DRAFT_432619 [Podospora conica]|nr:hypothetical protein QBC39DRAFT_432619 [Schizothecium conicum]